MFWPFSFLYKIVRFFFIFFVILAGFLALFLLFLPNISYLREHNPTQTRFMELYLHHVQKKGEERVIDHSWVPDERISSQLKRAVLVSEDDAFFYHHGFDWKQLGEAVKVNWKKKRFARGGSTITQQLVKNLYLAPDKNPLRKIREWILTYQMEYTLKKERIFEIYLNVVEWGPGVYGAEAASRYYFGVSSQNLTSHQAAFLAAILPNPTLLAGSHRYVGRINKKVALILSRMSRSGNIEAGEAPPMDLSNEPQSSSEQIFPSTDPVEEEDPLLNF